MRVPTRIAAAHVIWVADTPPPDGQDPAQVISPSTAAEWIAERLPPEARALRAQGCQVATSPDASVETRRIVRRLRTCLCPVRNAGLAEIADDLGLHVTAEALRARRLPEPPSYADLART
ncbi:MAG: hypothetical protein V3V08_15210, partial [Nannocystaceae bacterium]